VLKLSALTTLLLLATSIALAGAWGAGSFENDDACDLVDELSNASDTAVLASALAEISSKAKFIDAPQCAKAVASAEIVAAAHGRALKQLPAAVTTWLTRVKPAVTPQLLAQARAAVKLCRSSKTSELRELWAESNDENSWRANTADLLGRLK
jgi:hypothetical protein